ncbi:MAG TPA: ABC transporter ATP-binding protein [Gemmatimonadaceae bacterium]|nr:ABC transporter ATP-binding protein [Gemmatimonadaceae bacterium]
MSNPDVVVSNVSKKFGETQALTDVSFDVQHGELFGLVGPDGAGKSTLFRILTTLIVPDSGTASVLGFDVGRDLWDVRSRIGYMPGRFSLYGDLTVRENLSFFASVFGTTIEKGYELIAPIYKQIEEFSERRAADLSGGMKQKLALSCALVHRPEMLFLDEPTTGVDAVSRHEFWDQLAKLKASGLTILVSTPYMDEAMRCDRVALMQNGQILHIDRPSDVGRHYPLPLLRVIGAKRYQMLLALRAAPHAHAVYPFGAEIHFTDDRPGYPSDKISTELSDFLKDRGFEDVTVDAMEAGIEDNFMELMATQARAS